ncbi:thiamine-binding protein [Propioniciclava coleopterorum]|uniref:Thiamine-binding protein n=1 Tax=Propioniciclava coleopterorum TaxID=2714937 RepID=A0A6G7Y8W5_9ACTN|nr:thiamine-binding protein [Propioniciclava coleopterorum]QIK73057.1 thiamine-binding protein [Propioniciclava coleopterorum]
MLVAFSVAPSGRPADAADDWTPCDDASVHLAVAEAVRIVRASGLPNETGPMFTTLEGSWDECMDVVRRCCEAMERFGSRTALVLKADIRPGHTGELTGKVERVEDALRAASA